MTPTKAGRRRARKAMAVAASLCLALGATTQGTARAGAQRAPRFAAALTLDGSASAHEPRHLTQAQAAMPVDAPAAATTMAATTPFGPRAAELQNLPLYFIENRGQVDPRVSYYVHGARRSAYLTRDGITLALTPETAAGTDAPERSDASETGWAVELAFVNPNPGVRILAEDRTQAVVSYFKGPAADWHAGLATYATVVYDELWPGIDLVYSSRGGQLKYTFVVAPGADPGQIRLVYRGASRVSQTEAGRLRIETPAGSFEEDAPLSWQDDAGGRREVASAFRAARARPGGPRQVADASSADGFEFGFELGPYDSSQRLVIDPVVLAYCGFIGGTGGGNGDRGYAIAVDATGAAYVVGDTTSFDFPAVAGSFDVGHNGGSDAFVAKVSPDGTGLVYATFIGGTANDTARGVAVTAAGLAYVTGEAASNEAAGFPVLTGPDVTFNGGTNDAFVLQLNAAGTGLVYSGYIGGSGGESGMAIAVDGAGAAYVAGWTLSDSISFPETATAFDRVWNNQDGFVAKIPAGGAGLTYCSYLGGTGLDMLNGIAVDGAGSAYVTGNTDSNSFPTAGAGVHDTTFNGGATDAIVTKFNAAGSALVYSTFLGGSAFDSGIGIARDASGNVYVVGQTSSSDYPRTTLQTWSGGNDGFVTKLNTTGGLVYSGFVGGTGFDVIGGVAVDLSGNAFFFGTTDSTQASFPVTGGPDLTYNGGFQDAFAGQVNAAGSALVFLTYVGGAGDEQGNGIALDAAGGIYVVGHTTSTEATFPETVGPDLTYNAGSQDAFVAKLVAYTPMYYSVGTQSTALYTGNASATAGTLTLAAAAGVNVGVGDEIRRGSSRYYITRRSSSTVFSIQNSSVGGTPGDTNITFVSQPITIFRAFNLLSTAEAGSTDASHLNTADLVTGRFQLNWACYKDGNMDDTVVIDGYTTGAANYIRVFTPTLPSQVGASQRHTGTARTGFRLRPSAVSDRDTIRVLDNHVRVEGIEIDGSLYVGSFGYGGVSIETGPAAPVEHYVQSNIIYSTGTYTGIYVQSMLARVWNNVLHQVNTPNAAHGAIVMDQTGGTAYVYSNTVYDHAGNGIRRNAGTLVARNNVSMRPGGGYTDFSGAITQFTNVSSDATAVGGGSLTNRTSYATYFVNIGAGVENLHLRGDAMSVWGGYGSDLDSDASLPVTDDIDDTLRDAIQPDQGADEYAAATAVTLASFTARGLDSAVAVEWETASELDNVGFHLYRGASENGPWQRLTAALVPGLGSSPEGRRYSWLDRGLANGARYFYRLEDVDRSGTATAHGPVSATPVAGLPAPGEGEGEGEGEGAGGPEGGKPAALPWQAHGDPEAVSLRVLQRTRRGLTLELLTGGFYSAVQADGTLRLYVPGFFETGEPGQPAVPVKRAWVDAEIGRGARIVSARASDVVAFPRLVPAAAGAPQAVARRDGTYRAAFRRVAPAGAGAFPRETARVVETAFQEQVKRAYLELAPLRLEGTRQRLVLARRLVVTVAFDGRVLGEAGRGGSRGRREPTPPAAPRRGADGVVLARLAVRANGLHAVSWDSLAAVVAPHAPRGQGLPTASLQLSRQGQPVAFHVEPRAARFGPGSTLVFAVQSVETAYDGEAVFELALGTGGLQMAVPQPARTRSAAGVASLRTTRVFETNASYLPALLNARDPWFWDIGLLAPNARDYPFALAHPGADARPARLVVELHGGSDAPAVDPDHHVRVLVNGVPVGEARWDGLDPHRFEAPVDASVLMDGANALRLEDLDTTGAFDSVVYLDRFALEYTRLPAAAEGRLDGRATASGRLRATGFAAGARVVDVTGAVPAWLAPAQLGADVEFAVEADRSYLAVSLEALGRPEVRAAARASLRAAGPGADWIVIAPQALLPAAEPLVAERESQGLRARAVALEQVRDEFGHGERSPAMIRDFLAHAYHRWSAPPRYVLLLGDASYDAKGYLPQAARTDVLPTAFVRSAFLWTASDPALAAVNGDDAIPDLAIGRLSAQTLAEAEAAVQKVLAFEQAGLSLDGNAVFVADNPDAAGDFEANAADAASLLPGRPVEEIRLSRLGAATRPAVLAAFDAGASLVSYVGHGSQSLWASEGILRSIDVALLRPQPRQPLMLTMTCSNGYFVSPIMNGIAERFVLERDKGAIAAVSPSGLSVDAAAHLYHRAVVGELARGGHERLGDLLLAAQRDYAETGAFPELLALYHLFGDPALRIRPGAEGVTAAP